MRIATCIADLKINLLGNRTSVAIGQGWKGDVDQVIGERVIPARLDGEKVIEPERKLPETIADHLGHNLNEQTFAFEAQDKPKKAPQPAPAAPKE